MKVSAFKVGLVVVIIGMIWVSVIFNETEKNHEESLLKKSNSIESKLEMSTLGKVIAIVVLIFGAWFTVVGIIMPEERFDYVRIAAVVLIGFGIAIAMLDRKFNRK